MTPADLRRYGEALYGERWQTPLAADLGYTVRHVQRWVAGGSQIPDALRDDLRALVKARIQRLRPLAA